MTTFRILDDAETEFYRLPQELILCDPAQGIAAPDARRQLLAWLAESTQ